MFGLVAVSKPILWNLDQLQKFWEKKFMSEFHTAIITAQNYGDMILNT